METTEEKPFTWAELKEFCNALSEEQLKQTVRAVDDETSTEIHAASELGEDQYFFTEDEYLTTKEDYDPDYFNGKTFEEALATEDYCITPASSVFLFIL